MGIYLFFMGGHHIIGLVLGVYHIRIMSFFLRPGTEWGRVFKGGGAKISNIFRGSLIYPDIFGGEQ